MDANDATYDGMRRSPRRATLFDAAAHACGIVRVRHDARIRLPALASRTLGSVSSSLKGAAIRSMLLGIQKVYGAEALAAVKAAVPRNVAETLESVLPVQLYPVRISALTHQALRDTVGKGTSWAPNHAVGVAAAGIDFTGVYRVLLRALSYDTVWNRMETAWGQYNSQGSITWGERREGFVRGVVSGVEGYNLGMWHSVAGRAEGLIRMSGAKDSAGKVIEGDTRGCVIEITWTA